MNIEYVITNNHLGVGNKGLSPTFIFIFMDLK